MHAFITLLLAGVYGLFAIGVCAGCGLVAQALLAKDRNGVEPTKAARLAVSDFLLGCGFGPWCIGLLQLALLIVFGGFSPLFLAGCSLAVTAGLLFLLRGQVVTTFRSFQTTALQSFTTRLGVALGLASMALVAFYSLRAASIPLWHGDTLIYAYEAKALRDGEGYEARLRRSPAPNPQNYIRNNDHPLVYIGYMESGLSFSPDRGQDLAMRLGLQAQNLILVLVLVGLGLRLGGWIGVLAPILFLFAHYFGSVMDMAHREAFRIVPAMLCLGFLPGSGERLRLLGARTALLFASMLFLWSAHSGSLAVAPVVLASQALALRDWKSRGIVVLLCGLGFLIGGNHLLAAYLKTGDPLGFEFVPTELLVIGKRDMWVGPTAPAGVLSLPQRFAKQVEGDGIVSVATIYCGLIGVLWLAVRRKVIPSLILAVAFFCLIHEMEVLGLFDWIHPAFGGGFYKVPRYRLVLYPGSALLAAYFLARMAKRMGGWAPVALGGTLLVGGVFSAVGHWEMTPMAPCLVRDGTILSRLAPVKSCWGAVESAYVTGNGGPLPTILTDAPFIPWYYTDWPVMSLYDPRMRPARLATNADFALKEIDRLGVGMLVMNKAHVLSGTALGEVLKTPAYEKVVDCIYDEAFRRIPEKP